LDREKRKLIAEAGVFLALSIVLEYVTLFIPRLPQGGKIISLGMIPLLTFAILRGGIPGMTMGFAMGIIFYFVDPFFLHPLQYILDYPIAFSLVGVAGFIAQEGEKWIYAAIPTGLFLRFLAHFASGVIFFKAYMPEGFKNIYLYSAAYNAAFIIPTAIVCILIVPYLVKRFKSYK